MKRTPHQETELGIERWCFRCHEWWPEDGEFWYFDTRGNVMGPCKACWQERKREKRAA